MASDRDERVVRDADERRAQHRRKRLVVVAVPEQTEVGEQVGDLLLPEVPAPGRAVGRQPLGAERALVDLRVGAGREEQHDLSRLRDARLDELVDATRDGLRLALTPARVGASVGALVGDEQLDGVPEDRIGELTAARERLVGVELGSEQVVDGAQHLGSRAVVPRERQPLRGRLTALAEHGHVGVAEPVDRLELVADEEHVRVGAVAAEQVDDVALQAVRVLELVDHDLAEAQLLRLADVGVVAQQVADEQLQVLEVEHRLALASRSAYSAANRSSSACSCSLSRAASSSSAACRSRSRAARNASVRSPTHAS